MGYTTKDAIFQLVEREDDADNWCIHALLTNMHKTHHPSLPVTRA